MLTCGSDIEKLNKLGIGSEKEAFLSFYLADQSDEIIEKIENYGQNIFNNVIIELKKYI